MSISKYPNTNELIHKIPDGNTTFSEIIQIFMWSTRICTLVHELCLFWDKNSIRRTYTVQLGGSGQFAIYINGIMVS